MQSSDFVLSDTTAPRKPAPRPTGSVRRPKPVPPLAVAAHASDALQDDQAPPASAGSVPTGPLPAPARAPPPASAAAAPPAGEDCAPAPAPIALTPLSAPTGAAGGGADSSAYFHEA
jgi:hypothetical protein